MFCTVNIMTLLFSLTVQKYPAVVAELAKASVLIQVEWHQMSKVQIPLEVRLICSKKVERIYHSQRNMILITQSQKWHVTVQIAEHRVAMPLTISI